MTGTPGGYQLSSNALSPVDRDGESQPGTRTGSHQRVDPDHFTVGIEQRPTGVPRIDGCIGLNQIKAFPGDTQLRHVAVEVADDAHRHGVLQSEGVPHRNGPVAHTHPIGIAQHSRRPGPLPLKTHHCQIGEGIRSHHFPLCATTVGELHRQRVGPLHHVSIGEQQPFGIKNHPTALTALHPLLRWSCSRSLKEPTKKGIHQQPPRDSRDRRPLNGACCFEGDNRRSTASDGIGNERLTGEVRRNRSGRTRPQHHRSGGSHRYPARQQQRMEQKAIHQ